MAISYIKLADTLQQIVKSLVPYLWIF